ncbi:amidohydrolase [Shimia thalassica]|uniref:amidohydrolase n=1 Tax=Shimia thalassica TaxID=1715693 RepID=UPI0026E4191C|nr:amidohydrolase [Shimia thalassica]MDO6482414.1 amidohydrolase [Shimia thalassica]
MSQFEERLVSLRHDLHRHPELGFQETRTKRVVADRLRELGVEVHEGVGVVGVLRLGTGNRAIGLRADMDALPISEISTHGYVSTNDGVMHACGHDGHTTMLLGAAERLVSEGGFDGTVVFLFQPDEEHGGGAKAMIKEGVLSQFEIDEVYAIHNLPGAPVGQVSSRTGMVCSSESLFEFTITGQGGHSSMPHVGVEALTVGAELVLALQTIVSRKLAPDAGVVVSPTEFLTDGQRNVLPGQAVIKGDVRARAPEHRAQVEGFMRQIAGGLAAAHGVDISVSFQTDFVETFNADGPTQAAYRAGETAGCDVWRDRPAMSFSEDFAQFTAAVPGCFLMMGNGEGGPCGQPLHSADYDFNDALLPIGAEFWVRLVQDRLPLRKDTE